MLNQFRIVKRAICRGMDWAPLHPFKLGFAFGSCVIRYRFANLIGRPFRPREHRNDRRSRSPSPFDKLRVTAAFPILSILLLFLAFSPALAFGPDANRIIAVIAQAHLSEQTLDVLKSIMGEDVKLEKYADWAYMSTQKDPSLRRRQFITMQLDEIYYYPERHGLEENIITALQNYLKVLGSFATTTTQKRDAVKWLVCLTADLHQPLHVGENNDSAGLQTKIIYKGLASNLHDLWEFGLIRHHYPNPKALQNEIMGLMNYHENEYTAVSSSSIVNWAEETMKHVKGCYTVDSRIMSDSIVNGIPDSYSAKSLRLLKDQMKLASLRLAFLLNSTLEGEPQFTTFKYFWSDQTRSYHYAGCPVMKQITPENLVLSDIKPENKTAHQACQK